MYTVVVVAGVCVCRFMENLQTEVLEMEFNECSHGTSTIHEQDFARILLRYTILTAHAHEQYLDRLARRIPHSQVCTVHSPHTHIIDFSRSNLYSEHARLRPPCTRLTKWLT